MIFPKAYIFLCLAVSSLARLDVQELFEVDFDTNELGGCHYVGHERLNDLVADCIELADSLLAAVDDSRAEVLPLYKPARRLITAFFKPIIDWDSALDYIEGIYFFIITL